MSAAADKLGKWLAIGGSIAVGAVVALSIVATGTPMEQRRIRIDAGRVDDLQEIQQAVRIYWNVHDAVPADLATLTNQPGANLPVADREGRGRYEYARIDDDHYSLCAVFDTDTALMRSEDYPANSQEWMHPAGRHCFTRTLGKKDNE